MCRASALGFTVSKPYGETAAYDFIVDAGGFISRVQVRSVSHMWGGAYRVSAEARTGGEDLGKGSAVFVVAQESLELSRAAPRPDLLRAIAERTRGNELSLEPRLWREVKVLDPEVVEVDRRRNLELWDNGWALAAAVALFAIEWAVRRRSGYL